MLQFINLCAGYDRVERLHEISAAIGPGRLTAIIGPNGCGKSTLVKCAAGILRPTGGEVLLNGQSLNSVSDRERAQYVSYMPQSRIVPEISVHQLVMHGRYPHLKWGQNLSQRDCEIVEIALRRTRMDSCVQRLVSQLSGGERQRAYLAMMLAQQTPVMLLDEPTTYLDLSSRFALMELLRELCREGYSAVTVMHDLELALEYADDVLLMQDGRLVFSGTPEKVFDSGALQKVFGVDVRRLNDGKYVFSRRESEGYV